MFVFSKVLCFLSKLCFWKIVFFFVITEYSFSSSSPSLSAEEYKVFREQREEKLKADAEAAAAAAAAAATSEAPSGKKR